MKNEQVDLVDENNKLTGENASRSIVHSTGLWHRTVHIYLFKKENNDIQFLVHLRSKNKDLHPSCWDTRFGGHIKSGEKIEQGVINEVKEEIGLEIDISKLLEGKWRKRNKYPNREFAKIYYLEYNDLLDNLSFNDGEVQEVKWLSMNDILSSMDKKPSQWSGGKEGFNEVASFLQDR